MGIANKTRTNRVKLLKLHDAMEYLKSLGPCDCEGSTPSPGTKDIKGLSLFTGITPFFLPLQISPN